MGPRVRDELHNWWQRWEFDTSILCKGDAQFALQLVPKGGDAMVHRYCVYGYLCPTARSLKF